jgi:hypothetical protein
MAIQFNLNTNFISSSALTAAKQTEDFTNTHLSTKTHFYALHELNVEHKANIRGMVNYEYNRLLRENGDPSQLIPGGENLEELGNDFSTSITRPDLYYQAISDKLEFFKTSLPKTSEITTAHFFNLLHEKNVTHECNIRGAVNKHYNELISRNKLTFEYDVIPGDYDLERLGMDVKTKLHRSTYLNAFKTITKYCENFYSKTKELQKGVQLTEKDPAEMRSQAACILQSHIRSWTRLNTHLKCLEKTPLIVSAEATEKMTKEILDIDNLIRKLAEENSIVCPEVWHVTTKPNLSSICRNRAFLGADSMKRRAIEYRKNVLDHSDIDNGDGDVICLGPYLIDSGAFINPTVYDSGSCKEDAANSKILIKIDLTKTRSKGIYNQFFKIQDFGVSRPHHVLEITDWLTIVFGDKFKQTIILDNGFSEDFSFKEQPIIYGNLYEVNQFCLTSLFRLVETSNNKNFIETFYKKIKQCSFSEIAKIVKLYGQHLILYSEINFNQRLTITPGLITEIQDLKNNASYSLRNLDSNTYMGKIHDIAIGNYTNLPLEKNPSIYEFIIPRRSLLNTDYSNVNPEEFMCSKYINLIDKGQKFHKTHTIPTTVTSCNPGESKSLAYCCAPTWGKRCYRFAKNDKGEWVGEVPSDKEWKFIILSFTNEIVKWESRSNRKYEKNIENLILDNPF